VVFAVKAKAALLLVYACIMFVSVCANLLVIVVIASTRRLRTVTNAFFCSLAVSDSLVSLVNMPLQVEHSNSRFESSRFDSLCESIRIDSFCKIIGLSIH